MKQWFPVGINLLLENSFALKEAETTSTAGESRESKAKTFFCMAVVVKSSGCQVIRLLRAEMNYIETEM